MPAKAPVELQSGSNSPRGTGTLAANSRQRARAMVGRDMAPGFVVAGTDCVFVIFVGRIPESTAVVVLGVSEVSEVSDGES